MRLLKRLQAMFPSRWTSLRARMTISYVFVTVGTVFSFLLLVALASGAAMAFLPASDGVSGDFLTSIQRQAQTYALVASYQAQGAELDPHATFIPGQAHTLAVASQDNQNTGAFTAPSIMTTSPDPAAIVIALLVAPGGHLVASSYPARYPTGMPDSALPPAQARAIDQALAGHASTGIESFSSATLGYAAEPVWSRDHQPIGAIFLQVPGPEQEGILSRLWSALSRVVLLLVIVAPIGILFGWIATRSIVSRLRRLAVATGKFAAGDYTQRVVEGVSDEIGQLERQFNQMARQLVDNTARRQQLAAQNARLEERSRISRELHDAVSQDLFSLRMLADGLHQATETGSSSADLRPQIALLEQTTGSMTREMRALLLELRPTELENRGLTGALRKLASAYSARLGIAVTATVQPVTLDIKTEHALLRIAQEALANAARHSDATTISLELSSVESSVTLTVSDNGGGFATEAGADQHGLGLRIMRERVEELQGTFNIASAPGQGARICVTLPREWSHD